MNHNIKQTLTRFNWAKCGRCESALSTTLSTLKITLNKNDTTLQYIQYFDYYCFCCLSALLYKCEAQRSSCGQCLKAPPAFECGWCTETRKCLLRQHCPSPDQNWMHHSRHNLRCSHPRIAKVGDQTCNRCSLWTHLWWWLLSAPNTKKFV